MSNPVLPRLGVLAVAALVVIAACTADGPTIPATSAKIAPPNSISKTIGAASGGKLEVCIDASSNASATYTVTATRTAPGDLVTNPNDSSDNVDVFVASQAVTPNNCVDVLERFSQMNSNGAMCWYYNGPQPGTPADHALPANYISALCPPNTAFAAGWATITVTSSEAGATASWTCVLADVGTPSYCGNGLSGNGNTVRDGANKYHGAQTTFLFTSPVATSCGTTVGPWEPATSRSSTAFNESEVLAAYGYDAATKTVRAWYSDEHALSIGVRQVGWNWAGTVNDSVHTYNSIAQMGVAPATLLTVGKASSIVGTPLVDVGYTGTTGEGAAVDPSGRPIYPAVFITDLTVNGLTSKAGDWQNFGTPTGPNAIYGTWKSAALLVDHTKNPVLTTFSPDADPAKNHLDVGTGPAVPTKPTYSQGVADQGYTAAVVWSAAGLNLNANHNYRLQFMVHDGDQNKGGGDVGQACMNIGPGQPDRLVINGIVIH